MAQIRVKFALLNNAVKKTFQNSWFPLSCGLFLVLLTQALGFNGLYGQDAHEYFRLSGALNSVEGQSIRELAIGFPVVASLLRWLAPGDYWPVQCISWLSAVGVLYLFDALLRVLTPGARAGSRLTYTFFLLFAAPWFIRASLTVMSDALGLLFTLGAFFYGLRLLEQYRKEDAPLVLAFATAAFFTRYSVAPLLAPLVLAVFITLVRAKQWRWCILSVAACSVVALPILAIQGYDAQGFWHHSAWSGWSVSHWFARAFDTINGRLTYMVPNLLYAFLFPLVHPGFCISLVLLSPLFRRTDVLLLSKRVILVCFCVHGLFLAGFNSQNVRLLLPDYVLLLCILFPAWDRFFAYGFYFLKRKWMIPILGLIAAIQLFFTIRTLKPILQRNHLEQQLATEVGAIVPDGSVLYGFDVDIALKTYLPTIKHQNLWINVYPSFEKNAYFLFNEALLQTQWAGKNPMINWEKAQSTGQLKTVKACNGGWILYRID
jgi:hypothetical protein